MFDQAVVDAILATGLAGFGVAALTEMLKRLVLWIAPSLKSWQPLGYLASAIVSLAATFTYLSAAQIFSWLPFLGYSLLVFLAANGLYKMTAKAPAGR